MNAGSTRRDAARLLAAWTVGAIKWLLFQLLRATGALPLRVRYRLTDAASVVGWAIMRGKRDAARSNLRLILGRTPSAGEVLEVFRQYGRYWAEFPDVCGAWCDSEHVLVGDQLPKKRQFLGLTFHMGNFEMFGPLISGTAGGNLTVVAERLYPAFLASYFRKERLRHRIDTIGHDDARGIVRALRGGKSLGVVCDRSLDGKGVEVDLFGRKTRMPLNVIELARRHGIPVYASYCVRDHGQFWIRSTHIPDDTPVDVAMKTVTAILEDAVRRYPFQWHVLSAL